MDKLRKITYKFTDSNTEYKGYFHTWGLQYVSFQHGIVTIGIVESELSGRVSFTLPHNIKFIEPYEEYLNNEQKSSD